ncbi:hypothetical protein NDU88_007568 [Pleurodeles waltl]|uniref:Uncharacterized protein n=1 Tax=Pleurodeles waltl TaxID=8319 RepID=A0AAV7PPP0_PLEWA|nr:hypothetical protein NDU88_007568 [Pleurodeles waltl]
MRAGIVFRVSLIGVIKTQPLSAPVFLEDAGRTVLEFSDEQISEADSRDLGFDAKNEGSDAACTVLAKEEQPMCNIDEDSDQD